MNAKTKKLIVIYITAFLILVPLCYFIGITIFNMQHPSSNETTNNVVVEDESINKVDNELLKKLLGIIGLEIDEDENFVEIKDLYVYAFNYFADIKESPTDINNYVIMLYAINNNLAVIDNTKCNLSGKYTGNCYAISNIDFNTIKDMYSITYEDGELPDHDTYYFYINPTFSELNYEHNISSYYEDEKVVVKDAYKLFDITNIVYYTFIVDNDNIKLDSVKYD